MQQLRYGFVQSGNFAAADCLQVKIGVAGIVQDRGILAAVQQGVRMRERLLPLEGEEVPLRCVHSGQIGLYCIFGLPAINHGELHQRDCGICLLQAAACAAACYGVDAHKQIDHRTPIIIIPTKPGSGSNDKKFPFTDVGKYDDCYDAVKYLYDHDIMNGVSDTLFGPNMELTRGMVVTILYRMEGEPFTTGAKTFSDVKAGLYYSKAVEWAAENDIVNGFTDGTFKPEQPVTREQLAAILSRYAQFNGIVVYDAADALASTDVVSPWAKKNVAWTAAEGIPTAAQTADATRNANRAEVAMAIYTYLTKTAK